jgi:hypothetical protein
MQVLRLRDSGMGARRISQQVGVPLSTTRDWMAGRLPRSSSERCPRCGSVLHDWPNLPPAYVYLLGLYLGDGCISEHPRDVFKIRIVLDAAYPAIVSEARMAISCLMTGNAEQTAKPGCFEVYGYSKSWPCLLPQHGPGRKHDRRIELDSWQRLLVERHPELLLRGLIHSDGCRFENTGRDGWRAPRYSFSNRSADIRRIFQEACDLLGLHWTVAPHTVYVSRKADVARMDQFIGPKR